MRRWREIVIPDLNRDGLPELVLQLHAQLPGTSDRLCVLGKPIGLQTGKEEGTFHELCRQCGRLTATGIWTWCYQPGSRQVIVDNLINIGRSLTPAAAV